MKFFPSEQIYLQAFWVEIPPDIKFERAEITHFEDSQIYRPRLTL